MLSAAKPPYRTHLTIFARRHGNQFLTIADDLRQKKDTPLLGVATMTFYESERLTNFKNSYKKFKHMNIRHVEQCQLVVLDSLIHKSEKFVVRDTISLAPLEKL